MEHAGSVVSLIGFFLASVMAGIVFTKKTGRIGRCLDRIKNWIVNKSQQNRNSKLWEALSRPDAVTFLTLIIGTFLVLVGQSILVAINW